MTRGGGEEEGKEEEEDESGEDAFACFSNETQLFPGDEHKWNKRDRNMREERVGLRLEV